MGSLVQTTLGFLVLVGRNLLFLDSVSCRGLLLVVGRGLLLVQALICCTHDRYHLSVDLPHRLWATVFILSVHNV